MTKWSEIHTTQTSIRFLLLKMHIRLILKLQGKLENRFHSSHLSVMGEFNGPQGLLHHLGSFCMTKSSHKRNDILTALCPVCRISFVIWPLTAKAQKLWQCKYRSVNHPIDSRATLSLSLIFDCSWL